MQARIRVERDSMGEVRVPAHVYWGAQTQRAVENFPISGQRMPRRFIEALGLVKRACAMTNEELGLLPVDKAEWIAAAAQEVIDGRWDDHFPVDVFQTGSGTSTNMNANEVVANRAIELMGGTIGTKDPVHPNDHVNLCQSSNDVIPTALHVAGALALHEDLMPALRGLASELRRKAVAFEGVLKVGRTHLMDATPVRMGQEFAGYARQIELGVSRVERARDALLEVALGGTATGTGVNRPAEFPARAIARIADATGLPFREAVDHFEAQGAQDGVVEAHGALRVVAGSLAKIANDVRWMGSGPRAGLGELRIPETQAGSSIMPAKVNPVMSEMLLQVCAQVAGNDVAVGIAGASGVLELNTFLPLMVRNLLESTQLLANGARVFTQRCVTGLEADAAACAASVERNLMRVTALAPAIGYDRAAQLAREAQRTGASLRDVALAAGVLPAEQLDALLDPRAMTEPGGVGSGGHRR